MMYKWDPEKALELIEKERISVFHGVPTMTWEIMQSPKFSSTDISSLRAVQSGGAPRPPEHLTMILQKFPEVAIPGLGYGLTETNAIGAIISGGFYQAKPHSTGRPSPPVTSMRIIDENNNELPNGKRGEICIKGPTIMKGYWNQPEATAQVIKDGWFHTGDIGLLDALGFLIILDRAKDIVIRGGENIGCAEVEYAITEHPAVSEVSVYGIPDDRLGEIPCASVMVKGSQTLDDEELKKAGLKVTLPRIRILEILESNETTHLSADEIFKILLHAGDEVGLATVYRVLTQFEQAGICVKHNFEGGRAVYELTPSQHHDHMVCVETGDIIEFTDDTIEERQAKVADSRGYEIIDHSMVLYVRPKEK